MVVAKTGVWFVCMPSFCVKNGSVQSGTPEWKLSRQAHVLIFPLGLSINSWQFRVGRGKKLVRFGQNCRYGGGGCQKLLFQEW